MLTTHENSKVVFLLNKAIDQWLVSRTPVLPPLLPTAPSAASMSPSCVRRSPRSGPSASMLSNRSHVSSGGQDGTVSVVVLFAIVSICVTDCNF